MTYAEDLLRLKQFRIDAMAGKINELESRIAYLEANIEVLNTNIKSNFYENE
tara:strand:- start:10480 stop:10635 length:156 start_codon:yes stop_codon:yes gene_type:complete